MLCTKCGGSCKAVRGKFSGVREVWECKKCGGREEIKLWAEVVGEGGKSVVDAPRPREDEGKNPKDGGEDPKDERRSKMAKKAGLGSAVKREEVVEVVEDPKAAKKAAMKAKAEAKRAAAAAEVKKMVEAGATKTRGAKAAVKKDKAEPKDCPKCPCCGERTGSPKSQFLMGHDGRVKGWFIKKEKGKLPDEVEFTEEVEKMWKMWKKGEGLSIKEIAMKVKGIK